MPFIWFFACRYYKFGEKYRRFALFGRVCLIRSKDRLFINDYIFDFMIALERRDIKDYIEIVFAGKKTCHNMQKNIILQ